MLYGFPELSLLWFSGVSALAFCFFHCTPPRLGPRGPTSHRSRVCDPGAPTALPINLPGPPAVCLSAAAPLLHWMCYSYTSVRQPWSLWAVGKSDWPCYICTSSSVLCCILAGCRARALLWMTTWSPYSSGQWATPSQPWPWAMRIPSRTGVVFLGKTYSRAADTTQEAGQDRKLDRPRVWSACTR